MSFELNCENVDDSMLVSIVKSNIDKNTLISHHLDSFNKFLNEGIPQILTHLFKIEVNIQNMRNTTKEDKEIENINVVGTFSNVIYEKPELSTKYNNIIVLYPNDARKNRLTYSAKVKVDLIVTATAYIRDTNETIVKEEKLINHKIAEIPIMVNSILCHTHGENRLIKEKLQEDPRDNGGYFIIKGIEWAISMSESRVFNEAHVYRNFGHANELSRLELISKPGDGFENSSSLILKYVNNGNIYLTLESYEYFKVNIPFHLVMKLLGMISDQEICEHIVYGCDFVSDIINRDLFTIVKGSLQCDDPLFGTTYEMDDPDTIKKYLVEKLAIYAKHKTYKKIINILEPYDTKLYDRLNISIMQDFDKWLLPHLGMSKNDRYKKLRYLGHLVRKLLLVYKEVIGQTDRDALDDKRVHSAGISLTKAFKKDFNLTVVKPVKDALLKAFKESTFSNVSLRSVVGKAIDTTSLGRALAQSITTGDKEIKIKNKTVPNRVASESPSRKNEMTLLATLRTIKTASSTAANIDIRGTEMRRVHPSYIGYICPVQSVATGESVGLVKQMAMSCFIDPGSGSQLLKDKILMDESIIKLENLFPDDMVKSNVGKIFVNGDWIGGSTNIPQIYYKYRDLKRGIIWNKFSDEKVLKSSPKIETKTTIYWNIDADELHFWVDFGRPYKILPVVRNNSKLDPYGRQYFAEKGIKPFNEKSNSQFHQDILLTKKHISDLLQKKITVQDLINEGILECVSPQEMKNLLISFNMDNLHKNHNNPLLRYTHVEICQCILGLPALGCCFANRSQITRIIYGSNQGKQTLGIPVLSWPYRVDKHLVIQYYIEFPICKTLSQSFTNPNGINSVVAIMSHKGYNQEDSLYFNKSAAQRGYAKCINFDFEQTELFTDELFTDELPPNTSRKSNSNRKNLVNGFPPRTTTLRNGDVMIGKIKKTKDANDKEIIEDKSIIYSKHEEIKIFSAPIRCTDQEGKNIARLKYYSTRPLQIGDKFCLTECEVYTESGFKKISTIQENDRILTLNPKTQKSEFAVVDEFYKFEINEDVYENKYFECTMNHKVYCSKYPTGDLELIEAKCLGESKYYLSNFGLTNNSVEVSKLMDTFIPMCNSVVGYNKMKNINISVSYQELDNVLNILISYGFSYIITENLKDYEIVNITIYVSSKKYFNGNDAVSIHNYKGYVYCVNVKNHIFLMRKNKYSTPIWTGNSSRHGQKGVTGMGFTQTQMPFTRNGLIPDIVLNPHAFPSRMTTGQLIESHLSKISVIKGMIPDTTIFKNVDIDNIADTLEEMGLDRYCNEIMFDGETGEWIDTEIFIAPCYYQRLKKFVIEEKYSTSNSATCMITRQPLDGAANKGGLRIGEMEKDTIITHGTTGFLMGKYMDDSDGTTLYVCRTCGNFAVVNEKLGIQICKTCKYTKDNEDIFKIKSSYANRLFMQELQSMGIGIKFNLKPYEFSEYM